MTKKKTTEENQPLTDEQLRAEIKKHLPGTACRKIYDLLKPDMTLDRFTFVFAEAAAEAGREQHP